MTDYVLDQSWHAERERLDRMAVLWDPGTMELARRCGLTVGQRVLEVGAGSGTIAVQLAEAVAPDGEVVAVDIDTRFLASLDSAHIRVIEMDIRTEALPTPGFDLIHARMVLEHLGDAKDSVLERLADALRPGGWLLIEDLDWNGAASTHPPASALQSFVATFDALAAAGLYDPHFGRQLLGAFRRIGLQQTGCEFRGAFIWADPTDGIPPWDLVVDQLGGTLVGAGLLDPSVPREVHAVTHDDVTAVATPMMCAAFGRRA